MTITGRSTFIFRLESDDLTDKLLAELHYELLEVIVLTSLP